MLAQQSVEAVSRRIDADGYALLLSCIGASSKIVVKRFSSHQQRTVFLVLRLRSSTINGCADYYSMLYLQQICSKTRLQVEACFPPGDGPLMSSYRPELCDINMAIACCCRKEFYSGAPQTSSA
jgi:hypothetical protein